ncbi:outer membrane lipoprotein carrier protein LolA, partial [Microvirga sp. 3-52]|nr:outer membrane lipoprotein carrier protein LolA [Microvirga sp. 3-52]
MKDMRSRIFSLLVVVIAIVLTACGTPSKDNVTKKLSDKWNDSKGYELQATMEIKTGAEPRLYDVDVWHTKPDFYRVNVSQSGKDESQMIVRNEDGVFVVTPSLGKTYKFQSDWPAQNSQAYLIGALSED